MKTLAWGLGLLLLSASSGFAADVCEIQPLLRGSDGAAAHCTDLEDGRALNSKADLPKIGVVKKLLEMGYVAKSGSVFVRP
jgi:hypothetical protein